MISERHIINERGNMIPIKQSYIPERNNFGRSGEYELKHSFFDPSKSSPPNDFMLKLQMRMKMYNSAVQKDIDIYKKDYINDAKRDIE